MPRKPLSFNLSTNDGRLALVYEADETKVHATNTWKKTLFAVIPSMIVAC